MAQRGENFNPQFILYLLQVCVWKNGKSVAGSQNYKSLVEEDQLFNKIKHGYLSDTSSRAKKALEDSKEISLDPGKIIPLLNFIGFTNWSEFEKYCSAQNDIFSIDIKKKKLKYLLLSPSILIPHCEKYIEKVKKAMKISVELREVEEDEELIPLIEKELKQNSVVGLLIPFELDREILLEKLTPSIKTGKFSPTLIRKADPFNGYSSEVDNSEIKIVGLIKLFLSILTAASIIKKLQDQGNLKPGGSNKVFNISGQGSATIMEIDTFKAEEGSRNIFGGKYIENQNNNGKDE